MDSRVDLSEYNPSYAGQSFARRASAVDKRRASLQQNMDLLDGRRCSFDILMANVQRQKLDQQGKPVDPEAAADKDFNDKSDEYGLQNLHINNNQLTILHRYSQRNYNVCM